MLEKNKISEYSKKIKNVIEELINKGNIEEAKSVIKDYENIIMHDIDIYSTKAVIKIIENDLVTAKEFIYDGLFIDSSNFDLLYNMAYIYGVQQDDANAIKYLIKSLINCNDKELCKEIKNKLKDNYSISELELNKCSEENLGKNGLEQYKIDIKDKIKDLIKLKNIHEAKKLIVDYEDIIKDDVDICSTKAAIFIKENNYEKALNIVNKGLCLNENDFELVYNKALLLENMGDIETAFEFYKKAYKAASSKEIKIYLNNKILELQKKFNDNLNRIIKLRGTEFEKRFQRVKYAKEQQLVKSSFKNDIHIVYVLTHVGVCGGVKIILQHANYLKQLGAKVTLLSHFPKPNWFDIEADYIEFPFDRELAEGIPQCDIIVATYWDHVQASIESNKAPVVYFEQGDFHLFDLDEVKPELLEFIKLQFTLSKFIFTVSNQTAEVIRNVYGRESKVFHNSVDENIFNDLGIKYQSDRPYILMMGSDQTKFKGIDDILAAYRILKEEGHELDLIWITANEPSKHYEDVKKVFVNPSQQTIAELYRGAFMYVSASYYESFSLPVLEAMCCGCPVITTKNLGVLEYAKDRFNALFTEIDNCIDLADKMSEVFTDVELRSTLINNGKITAQEYKWSNIIPKLLDYYREVASYKVVTETNMRKKEKAYTKDEVAVSQSMISSTKDKISVIMPVYNGGALLKEAIESILNQTYHNFELLIVNDGSTDESESLILSYSDPRIKYIKQNNAGEAAARNTGLKAASGEFIVYQDADDVSLPIRFETLKRHFYSSEIGIVHSDMLLINEQSEPIGYWASQNVESKGLAQFFLKVGTPFNNASMMIRRCAFEGLTYDTSLKIGPDTHMVFQISSKWKSIHVAEPLYLYRRHSNNVSNNLDYEKVALHVRYILEENKIEDFFSELGLDKNKDNECIALALISLFLARRAMIPDAQIWFDKSVHSAYSKDNVNFINAIKNIINGDYMMALSLLESCTIRDHIIENYLGEVKALLGQINEAYRHFLMALEKNPYYKEPVENLKALGRIRGNHQLDITWSKLIANKNTK